MEEQKFGYEELRKAADKLLNSIPENARLVTYGFVPRELSVMCCTCTKPEEGPQRAGMFYAILENTVATLEGTDRFRLYSIAECPNCGSVVPIRRALSEDDIDLGAAAEFNACAKPGSSA